MTKKEYRDKYKQLRREIQSEDLENQSVAIANNVMSLPIWNKDYFHVFLPIESQNEVNTETILHLLMGKNKHIVISKSDFDTMKMHNYLLEDDTVIRKNDYGIPEPINGRAIDSLLIDVVVVPLLAFDLNGHRIGYGKGFYDRFLSTCRADVVKIGLSFFEAEESFSDIHTADILLNYCVTPKKVYRF
ncbi:MAG: 5-formyltetrahydrofolate cyclo-ligase [Flavobacterium sp.]|nr:5-formyltetrahydrofolate cyclo-ligase [Flavobacterium sp.]